MDECEALCDLLGIMISGQMQCFGTISSLKKNYGDGYRLVIKSKHTDQIEQVNKNIEDFVRLHLPTAVLEGLFILHFRVGFEINFFIICR